MFSFEYLVSKYSWIGDKATVCFDRDKGLHVAIMKVFGPSSREFKCVKLACVRKDY